MMSLYCFAYFISMTASQVAMSSPRETALLTTGNESVRYVCYFSHCYDQTLNRNTLWEERSLFVHSLAAVPHCGRGGKMPGAAQSAMAGYITIVEKKQRPPSAGWVITLKGYPQELTSTYQPWLLLLCSIHNPTPKSASSTHMSLWQTLENRIVIEDHPVASGPRRYVKTSSCKSVSLACKEKQAQEERY